MGDSLQVVIVGAGLGGLACAIACRKNNLAVQILERAPKISNVGAGIQVPPNSARVLERLGVLSSIAERSTALEYLDMRRYENGKLLCRKPLGDTSIREYGADWRVIHREDYHKVMLDEAIRLGATLALDTTVLSVDSNGTRLEMADGTFITADIVVGADGLWSTMRESFLNKPSPPVPTGDLAYRATFTLSQMQTLNDYKVEELCARKTATVWLGPGKHCVFYPLRGGQEFNLVLLRPDNLPAGVRTSEGDISEMRATFEGWDEILLKIISCISTVLKWKLLHHDELETWVQGHAALLGDACHPTLPYQAQGAAMAVEDGAALGFLLGAYQRDFEHESRDESLLSSSSAPNLSSLLKLYEKMRKTRTTLNVRGAVANRYFYHLPDGPEQRSRDGEMENFEFSQGRSEHSWLDTKYTKDLLAYDVLEDAKHWYDEWWRNLSLVAHGTAPDAPHQPSTSFSGQTATA